MHTLLLSLLLPTAAAADLNGDGCVDSFYDANTACVATTASLDASVVVETGSVVGEHTTIGLDTTIAAGVFVGPRTTITGRVSAPGTLSVQANTHIGRAVTIGADHIIGEDNSIGRSGDIGARIETQDNVALGYASTVGDDVFLGAGTVVGALVDIGNNTTIEGGTVLARGVTILDSSSSASIGGIIGPAVQVGADAAISTTARIRKRATLGDNVTVLGSARIGRDVQVGDDATIGANVRISAGAQVTANSDVPDGTVIARGEVFDNPASGVLETSGVKAWEDGTYASSCYTYRYPVDAHVYDGDTGNGVYNIDPDGNGTPIHAQCEMLRQGGGWTMGVKTWHGMGIYGNGNAVGSVSDALTTEGGNYKLSDVDINSIIGGTGNMDVMTDQAGYNSTYSTGNYEYITVTNYTGTFSFTSLMPDSTATIPVFRSFRAADDALAWTGRLHCGSTGGATGGVGLNCINVASGSPNPQGGTGCNIAMGSSTDSGWHHFEMARANTDTYIYICNGAQHSSGHTMNHRMWFRPNH